MLRVDMDDWYHMQLEEVQLQVNSILLDDTDVYFSHSWTLRKSKDRIN